MLRASPETRDFYLRDRAKEYRAGARVFFRARIIAGQSKIPRGETTGCARTFLRAQIGDFHDPKRGGGWGLGAKEETAPTFRKPAILFWREFSLGGPSGRTHCIRVPAVGPRENVC